MASWMQLQKQCNKAQSSQNRQTSWLTLKWAMAVREIWEWRGSEVMFTQHRVLVPVQWWWGPHSSSPSQEVNTHQEPCGYLPEWREDYPLPTWARKITCRRFDWMLKMKHTFAVCSIVITTLVPGLATRSMAPPIPFTTLPYTDRNKQKWSGGQSTSAEGGSGDYCNPPCCR